jgi:hypothetical protein
MTAYRSAFRRVAAAAVAALPLMVAPTVWGGESVAGGPAMDSPPASVTEGRIVTVQSGKGGPGRHYRKIPKPQQPPVDNRHNFGPSYPFGYNYKGPTYPFGEGYYRAPVAPPRHHYYSVQPAPAYVAPAPSAPRWVPGYWGQQWVPQHYTYDAWVPGYFARNGGWVQGYYESRVAESGGYYERVWVDGYWTE